MKPIVRTGCDVGSCADAFHAGRNGHLTPRPPCLVENRRPANRRHSDEEGSVRAEVRAKPRVVGGQASRKNDPATVEADGGPAGADLRAGRFVAAPDAEFPGRPSGTTV